MGARRERRKRAPEECKVYMYLSQNVTHQPLSDKARDKGENTRKVQRDRASIHRWGFCCSCCLVGFFTAKHLQRKLQGGKNDRPTAAYTARS